MDYISIVVPYYNSGWPLLKKCLDSLVYQTYPYYEIIIVVDGGTLNCQTIRKLYSKSTCDIRIVFQEHKGVSSARNLGINQSKGSFITFVDSDDYVDEDYLQQFISNRSGADLVICGVKEQNFPTMNVRVPINLFLSSPEKFNWIQYTNFSVNKLYSMSIIQSFGLRFPESIHLGEDALFNAEYIKHCQLISVISAETYHYVPWAASAVRTYRKRYWDWEKQVIIQWWDLFSQYPLTEERKDFMLHWLYTKINGTFNYYSEKENDRLSIYEVSSDIISFELAEKLLSSNYMMNRFFSAKEKFKIFAIAVFGRHYGLVNRFIRSLFCSSPRRIALRSIKDRRIDIEKERKD